MQSQLQEGKAGGLIPKLDPNSSQPKQPKQFKRDPILEKLKKKKMAGGAAQGYLTGLASVIFWPQFLVPENQHHSTHYAKWMLDKKAL